MDPVNNIRAHQDTKAIQMYRILDERMRVVEGKNAYGLDALDLCLVPDVEISPKFKMPYFEKYNGFSYPKVHLKMYCHKIATHARDDMSMIHCF